MRWVVRGSGGAHEVEVERTTDGFEVVLDGRRHLVDMICLDRAVASLRYVDDGRSFQVSFQSAAGRGLRIAVGEREFDLAVLTPVEAIEASGTTEGRDPSRLEAPIPGKVVAVMVSPGDEVEAGQALIVREAMKMENELVAEQGGRVASLHVARGATVETGELLVELD